MPPPCPSATSQEEWAECFASFSGQYSGAPFPWLSHLPTATGSSTGSATHTSSSSSTSSSTFSIFSAPPTTVDQSTANKNSTQHVGAIAGGTVAGAAVIFAILGLIYWRKRRAPINLEAGRETKERVISYPPPPPEREPDPVILVSNPVPPRKGSFPDHNSSRIPPLFSMTPRDDTESTQASSLLFSNLGDTPISTNSGQHLLNARGMANPRSSAPMEPPPEYTSPESNAAPLPDVPLTAWTASSPPEDALSRFASTNRDLIPPELEMKLRRATYMPHDNPADLSPEVWLDRYNVGLFELRRVQEAYLRNTNSRQSGGSSVEEVV